MNSKMTLSQLSQWLNTNSIIRVGAYSLTLRRVIPFILFHLSIFAVIWVGASQVAFIAFIVSYCLRIFALTGFYHRYFAHKSFKTNRFWQFVFAVLGTTAVQRGPLWWAANHRHHHATSDQLTDHHSPVQHSFWWSHMGWFLSDQHLKLNTDRVRDLAYYPELVFIDRFDDLVVIMFALGWFFAGAYLEVHYPQLGTSAGQMLVWGFFIPTICALHATFLIGSLAHCQGKQHYPTKDQSRNSFWLALITFGEGWHNNHHYFPGSARHGFYWWQIDVTYYFLRILALFNIIYDLKVIPDYLKNKR